MPISQDPAAPSVSSEQTRIEQLQREVHLGHLDEVCRQLRELPRRDIHVFVRLMFALEKENPISHAMQPSLKAELPVSRIVGALLCDYSETVANALLETGYAFRAETPERSEYLLEQLVTTFEATGDLANLAQAYLWRALLESDRRSFEASTGDSWRSLSCAHQVISRAAKDSVEWRKAARCLAGAQHQFGICCRLSGDFDSALLYYHRSLAVARQVDDWRRLWASEGSIANVFRDQEYMDHCLLHELHSLLSCLRGQGSPEMAQNALGNCYERIGHIYDQVGENEAGLTIYRRSYEVSISRRELLPRMCAILCELGRKAEAEVCLEELLNSSMDLGVMNRYKSYMLMVSLCKHLGKDQSAAEVTARLRDWILGDRVLVAVEDDEARPILTEALEKAGPDAHGQRALLLFALGRRAAARKEFEAAVAATAGEEQSAWRDLGERAQALNEEAVPKEEVGETGLCLGCGQSVPASSLSPNNLCDICKHAAELEDLVEIPAGDTTHPDGSTVGVSTFWMDRTPVTNRLFRLYAKAVRLDWQPTAWKHALRRLDGQPVTTVSRSDCEEFCRWRSRVTGRAYRLPTAAEWMRAALGDDGRRYPWGNAEPDRTRAAFALCEDSHGVPPPVGMFPAGASPFGVLDMAGTVFEWTASDTGEGQPYHLGGAFSCEAKYLNPHYLLSMSLTPATAISREFPDLGFRCVCDGEGRKRTGDEGTGHHGGRRS